MHMCVGVGWWMVLLTPVVCAGGPLHCGPGPVLTLSCRQWVCVEVYSWCDYPDCPVVGYVRRMARLLRGV